MTVVDPAATGPTEQVLPAVPPHILDADGDVEETTVWLFTCCSCGRRWTSPAAPISACQCGGDVVGHQFSVAAYSRIRRRGDPRPVGGAGADV